MPFKIVKAFYLNEKVFFLIWKIGILMNIEQYKSMNHTIPLILQESITLETFNISKNVIQFSEFYTVVKKYKMK